MPDLRPLIAEPPLPLRGPRAGVGLQPSRTACAARRCGRAPSYGCPARPDRGEHRARLSANASSLVTPKSPIIRTSDRSAPTTAHGVHVTLVDAHNYTTFPPMLFYVATAFLAPEDVVRPVRVVLPRGGNRLDRPSWNSAMARPSSNITRWVSWSVRGPGSRTGRSRGLSGRLLVPVLIPA